MTQCRDQCLQRVRVRARRHPHRRIRDRDLDRSRCRCRRFALGRAHAALSMRGAVRNSDRHEQRRLLGDDVRFRASRRHTVRTPRLTPLRRATSDMFASGSRILRDDPRLLRPRLILPSASSRYDLQPLIRSCIMPGLKPGSIHCSALPGGKSPEKSRSTARDLRGRGVDRLPSTSSR